tara:strand:+ start:6170 stop:7663 length:1494 start_codon:yes stop_codon:yes gene_type:complete
MKVIGQIAHEETVEHGQLKLGTTATTALAGNTAYDISCVDGANSDEENIRLTKSFAGTNIASVTDDVVLEAGTGLSIARSGDKITFTNTETDTVLTSEQVEDIIGAMVTGNTETNIAVTYDDSGGKLNFVSTDTDTVYTHPTGAGYNHIPSGGSSGQFLKYASAGTATWAADNDTTYSIQDGELSQNNFTNTLKTKLDGIAASANNYSHPTGNGNNHIPADGSSGQFLKYSSAGTAVWAADNNTTYSEASGSSEGLMSTAHHDKLDGIESSADVTDATNVTAAGALMDSECSSLASVKALDQGVATGDSPQFAGINLGHANDTTFARTAAGTVTIEGKQISTREKVIHIEHANFTDDLGTTEHFIPFISSFEHASFANEKVPMIMPVNGKLLGVHYKANNHTHTSSNEVTFRLYDVDDGELWADGNKTVIGTKVVDGVNRVNMCSADFQDLTTTGASGSNAFTASELVGVSIQNSQDLSTTTKYSVTMIFELDFSSY